MIVDLGTFQKSFNLFDWIGKDANGDIIDLFLKSLQEFGGKIQLPDITQRGFSANNLGIRSILS